MILPPSFANLLLASAGSLANSLRDISRVGANSDALMPGLVADGLAGAVEVRADAVEVVEVAVDADGVEVLAFASSSWMRLSRSAIIALN